MSAALIDQLESLYAVGGPGPDLAEFLARTPTLPDGQLAEVIEADGRARLATGRDVHLGLYLRAIPGLEHMEDALDAAIDVSLRALSGAAKPSPAAVAALMQRHPELIEQIRDAAVLNEAVCSTDGVRDRHGAAPRRELPCGFGSPLASGEARYRLTTLLGAGAFGEVYLALDRHMTDAAREAKVAVKVLSGRDPDVFARRRLAEEATKARRIEHENVVRVLDRGASEDGEEFVVYEYVDGGDLARRLAERPPPWPPLEAAALISAIARGVQAAHAAALVHCDLKPGNVMLTAGGVPKVADFGIAVRMDGDGKESSTAHDRAHPIGNMAFISPEQFRMDPGALSIPSDVYALGGLLYYLLTGSLPNGSTLAEVRLTHDAERGRRGAPSARAALPSLDRDLSLVTARAMATLPRDRYPSAAALADDLDAWAGRNPLAWTRPSAARVARLWVTRKPGLAAALLLLVVTVGVGSWTAARLRFRQAVADARREEVEGRSESAKTALMEMMGSLRETSSRGISAQLLPQTMLWELAAGHPVFSDPHTLALLWKDRAAMANAEVERARRAGQGGTLDTLHWESAAAFWMLNEGNPEGAHRAYTELLARWSDVVPGDPYLARLESFRACATIRWLLYDPAAWPDPQDRTTRLADAVRIVSEAASSVSAQERGDPAHMMYLTTLRMVYNPAALDLPEKLARVERALQQFRWGDLAATRAPGAVMPVHAASPPSGRGL